MPALQRVKPTIMLTVPMIMEKIVKKQVFSKFEKGGIISVLYKFMPFRKFVHKIAGKKLEAAFGGELKFFGIGGAKLDKKVERFLLDSGFPYAAGYGLTETSPLSAGELPKYAKLQTTGPSVKGSHIRISDGSDGGIKGEVLIKGPNVMRGYYKNPELTKEVFTEDGYFCSGDLGELDKNGFLSLKGRSKNMILSSNGENIYPEDIESLINNFSYVTESVVVEKKGKLVALVHFNTEEIEKMFQEFREDVQSKVEVKIDELSIELQLFVNARVSKYSRLQTVVVQKNEFEKTATMKIKRFLYM
jgi:long-chain acyl-CoA synthetase